MRSMVLFIVPLLAGCLGAPESTVEPVPAPAASHVERPFFAEMFVYSEFSCGVAVCTGSNPDRHSLGLADNETLEAFDLNITMDSDPYSLTEREVKVRFECSEPGDACSRSPLARASGPSPLRFTGTLPQASRDSEVVLIVESSRAEYGEEDILASNTATIEGFLSVVVRPTLDGPGEVLNVTTTSYRIEGTTGPCTSLGEPDCYGVLGDPIEIRAVGGELYEVHVTVHWNATTPLSEKIHLAWDCYRGSFSPCRDEAWNGNERSTSPLVMDWSAEQWDFNAADWLSVYLYAGEIGGGWDDTRQPFTMDIELSYVPDADGGLRG